MKKTEGMLRRSDTTFDNISIEAIKMLMALCPKKVPQELIEELEDWEREQRRKANEQ